MNSIVQSSLGVPCDFPRSMALKRSGGNGGSGGGGGSCVPALCGAAAPPLKPYGSESGFGSACRPRAAKSRYCAQTLRPCGTRKGSQNKHAFIHYRVKSNGGEKRLLVRCYAVICTSPDKKQTNIKTPRFRAFLELSKVLFNRHFGFP